MNFILKLKHWQIFILLFVASIMSNFTWVDHDLFNMAFNLSGILLYLTWYFIIGLELSEYLPKKIELPTTMFVINGFVLVLSIVVLIMFFDGSFSSNGIIGFLWVVYLMYATVQFFFYPSKILKSIELTKEARFGDYIGYVLLMIFWPIGIWWIQPKLNKLISDR